MKTFVVKLQTLSFLCVSFLAQLHRSVSLDLIKAENQNLSTNINNTNFTINESWHNNVDVTLNNNSKFSIPSVVKENVSTVIEGVTPCVSEIHKYICPDVLAMQQLSPNTLLRELRIESVQGSLSLKSNIAKRLRTLDLRHSNVTQIAAHQKLSYLETLILSHNPGFNISCILNLGILDNLRYLDIAGIKLEGFSSELVQVLALTPRLQRLDVSQCGLTSLHSRIFRALPALRSVNASHNPLHELQLPNELLYQIEKFDVSYSSLKTIAVVSDGLLRHRHKTLTSLNLSYNELDFVTPLLVYALTPHSTLDLTGNPLNTQLCVQYPLYQFYSKEDHAKVDGAQEFFSNYDPENITDCPWLACPPQCYCNDSRLLVDCSNAGLSAVPDFGPSGAEILLLDGNRISSLEGLNDRIWKSLRSLYIDDNQLTSLDPGGSDVPQLVTLHAAGNALSAIKNKDCRLLSSVRNLNLSRNRLVNLEASSCGYLKLRNVDFSHNYIKHIEKIELATLPYLTFLNVSHNSIQQLEKATVDQTPVLEVLDISFNHLTAVVPLPYISSPYYAKIHQNLQEIFLNNNALKDLKQAACLAQAPGGFIHLENNPWTCNCNNIQDIKDMLQNVSFGGGRCIDTGKTFLEFLKTEEFVCTEGGKDGDADDSSLSSLKKNGQFMSFLVFIIILLVFVLFLILVSYLMPCAWTCFPLLPRTQQTNPRYQHILILDICTEEDHIVRDRLILEAPNARLLHCANMNLYGRPYIEMFQEYLQKTCKVIVIVGAATYNDTQGWFRQCLAECNREARIRPDSFQMMGLLLPDAPTDRDLVSDRDFRYLVGDRRAARYDDSDYWRPILNFLSSALNPPAASRSSSFRWPARGNNTPRIRDEGHHNGGMDLSPEQYAIDPAMLVAGSSATFPPKISSQPHQSSQMTVHNFVTYNVPVPQSCPSLARI